MVEKFLICYKIILDDKTDDDTAEVSYSKNVKITFQ